MKRRLSFLIAAMAASAAAPAFAQGDPGKMFMINAVTPGVVSFSGEGTAQFNNSSSTANAFSVGSSTNFGVNASANSTYDYQVDSNALLQLAGTSQLQQSIGTSSSAANTMAAAEASAKAATSIANTAADEKYGSTYADYTAIKAAGAGGAPTGFTTESFTSEAAYKQAKEGYVNKVTSDTYSLVSNNSTSSSSQGASGQGIISGEFLTTNKSTSQIGATAGVTAENTSKASQEADTKFGTDYTAYKAAFDKVAGANGLINTETEKAAADSAGIVYSASGAALLETTSNKEWSTAKEAYMQSKFSSLQTAANSQGTASNESVANVSVTGVGSIATLNASEDSSFNVDVATRIRNQLMATNGTASGSAGGNLATSSFANQSNTQTASAFMQAFGADTVNLTADSTGKLQSATINGRFDVTLDADATQKAGTTAGTFVTDTALSSPVISVPK